VKTPKYIPGIRHDLDPNAQQVQQTVNAEDAAVAIAEDAGNTIFYAVEAIEHTNQA
jgi:hypothetical protein